MRAIEHVEAHHVPHPVFGVFGLPVEYIAEAGKEADQVIVAIVHNLGTAPAANVKVRIAVDGNQIGALQTIGSIPAGGSGRASVVWDTHGQNGSHSITATADPANAIAESNEGNNTGTRAVTVQGGNVH